MKSLTADKVKVARILLNLGHSFLHNQSLGNSEDEEEEGEEEEEGKEKQEKEEKVQYYEHQKGINIGELKDKKEFDGKVQSVGKINSNPEIYRKIQQKWKKVINECVKNLQDKLDREVEVHFEEIVQPVNRETRLKFDKALQIKYDEEIQGLDENVQIKFVIDELKNNEYKFKKFNRNAKKKFEKNVRFNSETIYTLDTKIRKSFHKNPIAKFDIKQNSFVKEMQLEIDRKLQKAIKSDINPEIHSEIYQKLQDIKFKFIENIRQNIGKEVQIQLNRMTQPQTRKIRHSYYKKLKREHKKKIKIINKSGKSTQVKFIMEKQNFKGDIQSFKIRTDNELINQDDSKVQECYKNVQTVLDTDKLQNLKSNFKQGGNLLVQVDLNIQEELGKENIQAELNVEKPQNFEGNVLQEPNSKLIEKVDSIIQHKLNDKNIENKLNVEKLQTLEGSLLQESNYKLTEKVDSIMKHELNEKNCEHLQQETKFVLIGKNVSKVPTLFVNTQIELKKKKSQNNETHKTLEFDIEMYNKLKMDLKNNMYKSVNLKFDSELQNFVRGVQQNVCEENELKFEKQESTQRIESEVDTNKHKSFNKLNIKIDDNQKHETKDNVQSLFLEAFLEKFGRLKRKKFKDYARQESVKKAHIKFANEKQKMKDQVRQNPVKGIGYKFELELLNEFDKQVQGIRKKYRSCSNINIDSNGGVFYKIDKHKSELDKRIHPKIESNKYELCKNIKNKFNADHQKSKKVRRQQFCKKIQVDSKLQKDFNGKILENFDKQNQILVNKQFESYMDIKEDVHQMLSRKQQDRFQVDAQKVSDKNKTPTEETKVPNETCEMNNIEFKSIIHEAKKDIQQNLNKEIHVGSEMQQISVKNVSKKLVTEKQHNVDESVQNIVKEINKNEQKEFDSNKQFAMKEKMQKIIYRKIQNKVYKNTQEVDMKVQVKLSKDILLKLELNVPKQLHKELLEDFYREMQQEVENFIYYTLCDEVQQKIDEKTINVKKLQKEIIELEQKHDEALENIIIKRVDNIYAHSAQSIFLEYLLILLNKNLVPLYKKVETLYNLYPPSVFSFHKRFERKVLKKLQLKLIKEIKNKFYSELFQDVTGIHYKKLNGVIQEVKRLHHKVGREIHQVVDGKIPSLNEKKIDVHIDVNMQKVVNLNIDEKLDGKILNCVKENIQLESQNKIRAVKKNEQLDIYDKIHQIVKKDFRKIFDVKFEEIIREIKKKTLLNFDSKIQQEVGKKLTKKPQVVTEEVHLEFCSEILQDIESDFQEMFSKKIEELMHCSKEETLVGFVEKLQQEIIGNDKEKSRVFIRDTPLEYCDIKDFEIDFQEIFSKKVEELMLRAKGQVLMDFYEETQEEIKYREQQSFENVLKPLINEEIYQEIDDIQEVMKIKLLEAQEIIMKVKEEIHCKYIHKKSNEGIILECYGKAKLQKEPKSKINDKVLKQLLLKVDSEMKIDFGVVKEEFNRKILYFDYETQKVINDEVQDEFNESTQCKVTGDPKFELYKDSQMFDSVNKLKIKTQPGFFETFNDDFRSDERVVSQVNKEEYEEDEKQFEEKLQVDSEKNLKEFEEEKEKQVDLFKSIKKFEDFNEEPRVYIEKFKGNVMDIEEVSKSETESEIDVENYEEESKLNVFESSEELMQQDLGEVFLQQCNLEPLKVFNESIECENEIFQLFDEDLGLIDMNEILEIKDDIERAQENYEKTNEKVVEVNEKTFVSLNNSFTSSDNNSNFTENESVSSDENSISSCRRFISNDNYNFFDNGSISSNDNYVLDKEKYISSDNESGSIKYETNGKTHQQCYKEDQIDFEKNLDQKVDIKIQEKFEKKCQSVYSYNEETEQEYNEKVPAFPQTIDRKSQEQYDKNKLQNINLKYKFKRGVPDVEKILLQIKEKKLQEIENSQVKFDRNAQDQFDKDMYQHFRECQNNFYDVLKKECDDNPPVEVNNKSNIKLSQFLDKQKLEFFESKQKFYELKHKLMCTVQQKTIESFQQRLEDFQENIGEELSTAVYEKKELDLEEINFNEVEPEFEYNIPLEFEEEDSIQKLKRKKINLYNKLNLIYKEKLRDFVDSKHGSDNNLYPSNLLDTLFDNHSGKKINVLLITLYSIDIGYSIQISMDKYDLPIEIFFSYAEDTILEYVEKEELPPHLLDIFEKAKPSLFYCGCIIAEIHDQKNSFPGKKYRILLRPSNMSIEYDVNRMLVEYSFFDLSSDKLLKLESMLLLASHRILCMDISPVAGLAVKLQNQVLRHNCKNLNPMKKSYISSNMSTLEACLLKESHNNILESHFLDETQGESSKCLGIVNNIVIHHLIWKFDFRLESITLMKLSVLEMTETHEYSILMCSKIETIIKMRFKINLVANQIKTYINVILEILKQKISPDILVVRRYYCHDKSTPRPIIYVPMLINNNIYEPYLEDISRLIENLLENKFDERTLDYKKMDSPTIPLQLFTSEQCIGRTKENSKLKKRKNLINRFDKNYTTVNGDFKSVNRKDNTPLENTIRPEKFTFKNYELFKLNLKKEHLKKFELNETTSHLKMELPWTSPIIVDSSASKNPSTLMDILLGIDKNTLPEINSTKFETNITAIKPSSLSPIKIIFPDDISIEEIQEELGFGPDISSTLVPFVETVPLVTSPVIVIPSVTGLITVVPSVTGLISVIPSVTSPITVISSVTSPITVIPTVTDTITVIPSVTSSVTIIPSVTSLITIIPSMTSPINIIPSVYSSVAMIPSVTSPTAEISLISSPTIMTPLVSSPVIAVLSKSNPVTAISLVSSVTEVILPSIPSPIAVTSSASNHLTVIPSILRPITVISSLESPIVVISSVTSPITVVSSTTSAISSSNINSLLSAQNLFSQIDRKTLPGLINHSLVTNTKSSINSSKTTNTNFKLLKNSVDFEKNQLEVIKNQPSTLKPIMKTASETLLTQSLSPEKLPVFKHVHENGICINEPKNYGDTVNNLVMHQAISLQEIPLEEQTITNHQLDRRKKGKDLGSVQSTDVASQQSNKKVTLPSVIVPLSTCLNELLNQVNIDSRLQSCNESSVPCQPLNNIKSSIVETTISSTFDSENLDSFQKIKNTAPSNFDNIDGYRGIKRKRTTS